MEKRGISGVFYYVFARSLIKAQKTTSRAFFSQLIIHHIKKQRVMGGNNSFDSTIFQQF